MKSQDLGKIIKKHPFGCGAAALALLVVVGWYFRSSELPAHESRRATVLAEKNRLEANIRNSAQLQEHLDALVKSNQHVTQRLIKPGELALNQQYFYKIESEAKVKITDLRPLPSSASTKPLTKGVYVPVAYSCTVQGSYGQILYFLRKLESGYHFQRVVGARMAVIGGEGDPADPQLMLTLTLELLGQA